jgi:hypothetical protein
LNYESYEKIETGGFMCSKNELSITESFSELLESDLTEKIAEIAELGLDAILEDGLLRDVPLLSTAVAVFKFGTKIKFAHEVKKLATFISSLNNRLVDKESISKHKARITEYKDRKRELEYLLVVLEKYLEYEKAGLLAKLYIAYLDEIIDWNKFLAYSVVVNQILSQDIEILLKFKTRKGLNKTDINDISIILRLSSLGLVEVVNGYSVYESGPRAGVAFNIYEHDYRITEFGKVFIKAIDTSI